ncbi:MAG: glutamine--fructose-6-phosphate transaminase (isomerizing) [Candidatus Azambacteria bacterium]|nr:glutamine--fructose-6-phosphate transaminase (isomerizing) [Candidatus Azambacteria bacterium]
MCGIVGYIGKENAIPILINGLKRLEYRGYDSAGFVVFNNHQKRKIKKEDIKFAKAKGKVEELQAIIDEEWVGNIGIAHTRWATHGEPSELNSHPHIDCYGRVFVCHNGIIENYQELKEALISRGHKFKSETDTEVLSHLFEENLRYVKNEDDFIGAVNGVLGQVKGTYGLAAIFADYPDKILIAKNSSPLVIGIGKEEYLVASDASAIVGRTKDVIYLKDGEGAILTRNNIKLFNILHLRQNYSKPFSTILPSQQAVGSQDLNILNRKEKLDWDVDDIQKNGYPHFMLKEIFEQPESISNSLRGRLIKNEGSTKLGGLENVKERLKNIDRLIITGCGTAYLAGMVGKYMIEEYVGLPCDIELASELRHRNLFSNSQNLAMVAISQSGETADTLAALRNFSAKGLPAQASGSISSIKEKNSLTFGIINIIGSTIARETDAGIYNHAGPEIGVASTKAFTSQLTILALLTLFLGRERGTISQKMGKNMAEEIGKLPQLVNQVLKQGSKIKKIAEEYKNFNNFLYIGRNYNFPVAFEGALKLKEISYIHAEGCGAGEMKHGPIAMIDENFPVLAIAPVDSVYEKMVSNMEEIRARQGNIIAITTEGNNKISHIAKNWLYIPKTLEMLTPILSVIPLQLFAYYISVLRGLDPDKPRNLAKSVTVE